MMRPKCGYMQELSKYLPVALLVLIPVAAGGQTLKFNFANPVVLAPTETPGDWYPDRYAPGAFISQVTAPDGTKNTLEESIYTADYQTPAPSFYNTQGRKYDLIANTYSLSINLYVPSSWETQNARMAGFWATAVNSSNVAGNDYPIVEFQGPITSDIPPGPGYYFNNGVPGFYGWDNTVGGWVFIGLPAGFKYNTWVELTMTLMPGIGFEYSVSNLFSHRGVSLKTGFFDPTEASLGNVILEGYNYDTSYSIFWEKLSLSSSSLVCGTGSKIPTWPSGSAGSGSQPR